MLNNVLGPAAIKFVTFPSLFMTKFKVGIRRIKDLISGESCQVKTKVFPKRMIENV